MKRLFVMFFVFLLLLASCASGGNETAFSEASENSNTSVVSGDASSSLISENSENSQDNSSSFEPISGGIDYLHITTSLPMIDMKIYSQTEIRKVTEFINALELESDFAENPDEYVGLSYSILVKYIDGSEREFILFSPFFKEVGSAHAWYKMNEEQGREFDSIVENLSPLPDNLDPDGLLLAAKRHITENYCTDEVLSKCVHDIEYIPLNGRTRVIFELCIYGYKSDEEYWVIFDENGEIIDDAEINGGRYSRYLNHLLSYDEVKAAQKRLVERAVATASCPEDSLCDTFLTVDGDGRLCLCIEVIVDFEPKDNGDGTVTGGCGFDHEHIFLYECISTFFSVSEE